MITNITEVTINEDTYYISHIVKHGGEVLTKYNMSSFVFHSEPDIPTITKNTDPLFKSYRHYGVQHRYNGPAHYITYDKKYQWFIHGYEIDEHEYKDWLNDNGMNIDNLTNDDKLLIDLKWIEHDT